VSSCLCQWNGPCISLGFGEAFSGQPSWLVALPSGSARWWT
jgi:hypothetical protein